MIYIESIPSVGHPESFEIILDDRLEKVELIDGVAFQDGGRVKNGDSFSVVCIFTAKNYKKLVKFWEKRKKVKFTDETEKERKDMTLVIKKVKYLQYFPDYVTLTFELWSNPEAEEEEEDDGDDDEGEGDGSSDFPPL